MPEYKCPTMPECKYQADPNGVTKTKTKKKVKIFPRHFRNFLLKNENEVCFRYNENELHVRFRFCFVTLEDRK